MYHVSHIMYNLLYIVAQIIYHGSHIIDQYHMSHIIIYHIIILNTFFRNGVLLENAMQRTGFMYGYYLEDLAAPSLSWIHSRWTGGHHCALMIKRTRLGETR